MNTNQKRILIVDDNPNIHEDFKKILLEKPKNELDNLGEVLFGKEENFRASSLQNLQIDSAHKGEEAAELVKAASLDNRPYALAFVDIRMPPGWDGINTIKELWKIDPNIQIVICTAYSEYSWQEMFQELKGSENFLILKKPFDSVEVKQLAASLTKKWEYKCRIQHIVENLETAVNERTEELSHALELAGEANHLKNEFLRNISHELRTPLTAILGFTELMYYGKAGQENFQQYHRDILASAKYLLQMINDIIDMSVLEAKSITLHPEFTNINLIVGEIEEMFRSKIADKNIEFSSEIESTLSHLIIDPVKLKQVIRHYVSNAIKFTPNGGKIKIRIFPCGADQFQIEVIDTGIGIHEDDIEKLFIPFRQLDMSSSRKYQGTGLGLALTRRIVEFQGGKVGVNSDFGKGSAFYAVLPLKLAN